MCRTSLRNREELYKGLTMHSCDVVVVEVYIMRVSVRLARVKLTEVVNPVDNQGLNRKTSRAINLATGRTVHAITARKSRKAIN